MSKNHLEWYVTEFAGRHNVRNMDTVDQWYFYLGAWMANSCPIKF